MKKLLCVVSLVVLFCFAFACQNKAEKAELETFKAQAALEEQNKALAKRFEEAWNKGDYEALKEIVAPAFTWYSPSTRIYARSLNEAIEKRKAIQVGVPDFAISIEESLVAGDRVISRFVMTGTHQGELFGVPATGNKIEASGIVIARIEDGKIVEDREDFDTLGLMQQLGMELRPKEIKK